MRFEDGNDSAEAVELIVIEFMEPENGERFAEPMGGFQFHNAALGELFESSTVRGYTLAIAAGGRVGKRHESYDRLLIALSDLRLREEINDLPSSDMTMKQGEVCWIGRGVTHSTTNTGSSPAALLTLEFK
jgi:hypothetical protein